MIQDELTRQFYALSPANRRPEKATMPRAIVSPGRVVARLREAADSARQVAMAELELRTVHIRWLAPPSMARPSDRIIQVPRGRDGVSWPIDHPREIFVSVFAGNPVNTVLHESRHLWQGQHRDEWFPEPTLCQEDPPCGELTYTLDPDDEDRVELDAFRWAGTTMRELRLPEFPRCEDRGLMA